MDISSILAFRYFPENLTIGSRWYYIGVTCNASESYLELCHVVRSLPSLVLRAAMFVQKTLQ